jgi:hypothetical protein
MIKSIFLSSTQNLAVTRQTSRPTRIIRRSGYSSIVLTHSHPPLNLSFHKLTLLSPVLTARALPLRLQLTRHATASTFSSVRFHSPTICQYYVLFIFCVNVRRSEDVQMITVLSWDAEAMYDLERTVGDHATSRTQSR